MSIWAADEYVANARIKDVRTTEYDLVVDLEDGRVLSVPLIWYPRLFEASAEQRADWLLVGGGHGIHWPQIDEDLSVEGLILGIPASGSHPSPRRWAGAEAAREMWADILAEETGVDVRKVTTGFETAETTVLPSSSLVRQGVNVVGEVARQVQEAAEMAAKQVQEPAEREAAQRAQDAAGRGGKEEPDATQAARRKAEELGVDLSQVEGSYSNGTILVWDVTKAAERYGAAKRYDLRPMTT